jgi:arylamine N-acetyltransferase
LAQIDPAYGAIDGVFKINENSKKWKSPYMHHKICAKQKRDNLSALANRRLEIKRGGIQYKSAREALMNGLVHQRSNLLLSSTNAAIDALNIAKEN